jgi:hypothetical protein
MPHAEPRIHRVRFLAPDEERRPAVRFPLILRSSRRVIARANEAGGSRRPTTLGG